MKISDYIFRFKTGTQMGDGLCRVRLFVKETRETVCVLTDIGYASNTQYLFTLCDKVINQLQEDGYLQYCDSYVLYDEVANTISIIDKFGRTMKYLSKEQLNLMTECDEKEFLDKSMNITSIRNQIEKKRYEINPYIDKLISKSPSYIKRALEIEENAISKEELIRLVKNNTQERELDELLKRDLSLVAEMCIYSSDEYIVFSEFPIGDKRVDFAIFYGRSTMDVYFIEIKGADFNLKKRGSYNSLNAKIEEAKSQIRDHNKYIYNEYEAFRKEMHNIRERVESGEQLYNSFLSAERGLKVDPNKNINIEFIIVGGRTPDNDINESDLRYQYEKNETHVQLYSWDSWIRRLTRN